MAQTGLGHNVFSSANDQYPLHLPGEVFEVVDSTGRKKYKYVNFDNGSGNLTLAAGNLVYFLDGSDFDGYTVTSDVSDTDINQAAGVALGAITDAYYGFVQTWGYYSAVVTNGDDDIAASDALIGGGDGTVNSTAQDTAPTNKVVGWAVAADVDASNTVAAYITLE